ncbi:hypothetical protein BV25DRAFT_1785564, partial [Artomyces pyxidatus]
CNSQLKKSRRIRGGKTTSYPIRRFVYHDMKAWVANMLSRADVEKQMDRDVFDKTGPDWEHSDIWHAKVLQDFRGPDGAARFVLPGNREGRYVFSLCMDGFNPFVMKEAGKKVSV